MEMSGSTSNLVPEVEMGDAPAGQSELNNNSDAGRRVGGGSAPQDQGVLISVVVNEGGIPIQPDGSESILRALHAPGSQYSVVVELPVKHQCEPVVCGEDTTMVNGPGYRCKVCEDRVIVYFVIVYIVYYEKEMCSSGLRGA